jgi:beta-lactamase superfamily II metal-dependent hydrolase
MRRLPLVIAGAMLWLAAAGALDVARARAQTPKPAPPSLEIYSIDVEGGQATLLVSPSGESMLIDAGFPGTRDARRIAAAAMPAGVKQIDYFVNTHFHLDHFGSIPDLVTLIPVRHFVDSGEIAETGKQSVAAFQTYASYRQKGRHLVVKAGDTVPIAGLDVRVVIAAGTPVAQPLTGAGAANPLCRDIRPQDPDPTEDARSVGVVVSLGRFRMIDLGDLTWNKENELACPNNKVGTVDLYVSTRHGLNGSGSPALVHALRPRVAVINNAGKKGASREHFLTMKSSPGIEDVWQLHYSVPRAGIARLLELSDPGGPELNTSEELIANPDDTTEHYIRVSAREDGSFTVTNSRNGRMRAYAARP